MATARAVDSDRPGFRRWIVLAVGTGLSAVFAALQLGLAALGPRFADEYALSLTGVGLALGAVSIGMTVTLVPWGLAIDRFGEARIVAAGLAGCAGALAVPVVVGGLPVLLASLVAAGMCGSVAVTGGSRSIVAWFVRDERGFALGVRQSAIPLGAAAASFTLPWIAHHVGVRGTLATLAAASLCGAACALALLHPPTGAEKAGPAPAGHVGDGPRAPWRNRQIWLLAVGVSGLQATQAAMIAFLVVLLHRRGLSVGLAAALAGLAQLLTAGARVLLGRLSDRPGGRVVLLRRVAYLTAALMAVSTILVSAPLAAFAPAVIAATAVAGGWNGVAFATVTDLAAADHLASALNFLALVLTCIAATAPLAFGVVIDQLSWQAGLAAAAIAPVLAVRALGALADRRREN